MAEQLAAQFQHTLAALADPARAAAMRAYLRDQFPFLGIPTPARRAALKPLLKVDFDQKGLLTVADQLWRLPEREYRYAAIDLLARHVGRLDLSAIAPLLALAQRDPWWETVDGLAGIVGDVVRAARRNDPDAQVTMDAALRHYCLWVRRIAMIHQLGWRLETDRARLFSYAETLAPEGDFFIRKGIGWALRDYARWHPQAVREFVAAMGGGCRRSAHARQRGALRDGCGRPSKEAVVWTCDLSFNYVKINADYRC
ncbi:MAG: DNA alkylation repair protein [Dechloromonas sp.]|uniref:DNA alkylation repair protein n=1 Tax=Candidatus Dechloromonas phosphorivorans TaxID=2899244 RepID=A0A9D7LKZ6_9RHOO|nr:DNA alkylation repair protein [Candidatus Dechloromonas phosphorivorans]